MNGGVNIAGVVAVAGLANVIAGVLAIDHYQPHESTLLYTFSVVGTLLQPTFFAPASSRWLPCCASSSAVRR